jgi:hypothetical protein
VSRDQAPRPRPTLRSARPGHALAYDRDDDTLGLELEQVYARLSGQDDRRHARRRADEDEREDR